ncbi:MAG TPA: hypothetical protein VFA16_05540 [Mycobacterium sp.]|uniref:hypothetical protein n=1 Tax=Mycobacterium sp. TaxID=1785 RepID=UPI002D4380A3|nr:hypothetical protein [Mycobacterium sp.]HZU46708.1 hypothetical protein [Mycobacterium sp.]
MPWWFHNRITVGDRKLEPQQQDQWVLHQSEGETVTLWKNHDPTSDVDWLRLDGIQYETSDAAFEAGRRWRQYISIAFARLGIAVDLDPNPLPMPRRHVDRPMDPEVPGLLVIPRPPPGLVGRVEYWTEIQPPIRLDNFTTQDLPTVQAQFPNLLTRRLELAYNLFHLALAQANPELKYILLITAVEALIPDERPLKAENVIELLELLRKQAMASDGFNRKARQRVAGILEIEKIETITKVGKTLAEKLTDQYDGQSAPDFFEVNYAGRSALVHGSTDPDKRPSPREVQRRIPHLQQFVLDLLTVESA